MALINRSTPILLLAMLLLAASGAQAQAEKDDPLAPVRTCSDSLLATAVTALANSDSALLASIFIDSVGMLMPGNKPLSGKQIVTKYFPLFFRNCGGGELTTTRLQIDPVRDYDDIVREAGQYTVTRRIDSTQTQRFTGHYTVYWGRRDSTWVIERLFIADR